MGKTRFRRSAVFGNGLGVINDAGVETLIVNNVGQLHQHGSVLFTENGAGTYRGEVVIPAGAVIENIIVHADALWAAATSAVMEVGDFTNAAVPVAIDADGFFTAINLKATDLLVGESIDFFLTGGKQGAYLPFLTSGQNAASHVLARRSTAARRIRGTIVSVGAGTTGRTLMTVVYSIPIVTAATRS